MVNAASVVAMMRYFRGQRQSVWEKAESTRNGEVHDVQFEEAVPLHLPETLVASVKSATEDEPVRVKAIKN